MTLRALLTAATTVFVAIALAVLVPIAQLATTVEKAPCCCPSPDTCKCKHDKGGPSQPMMKSCRGKALDLTRTTLPEFEPEQIAQIDAPSRAVISVATPLPDPHPAPAPRRPDAPS